MGDSDSDDDLFAAKDVSTRCGRVVKPAEPFRARPAPSQASATARMLETCDFLKQVALCSASSFLFRRATRDRREGNMILGPYHRPYFYRNLFLPLQLKLFLPLQLKLCPA